MLSSLDGEYSSLGQRIQAARDRAFVGRGEELALFRATLGADGSFGVLYVHGPGGIGKSALLRRFATEARAAGRRVVTVDGHTVAPSPAAFEAQAGEVLTGERVVLLVDTFELCQGLAGWLRERFLPRVPVGALVVVAGRNPPDLRWQADPGWAEVLRVIPLRPLAPEEAMELIDARGVASELREPLLAFAGGHPLALCLGAAVAAKDERASVRWTLRKDVAKTLLDQLVGEVPSPAHRQRAGGVRARQDDHRGAAARGAAAGRRAAVRVAAQAAVHRVEPARPVPARGGQGRAGGRSALARPRGVRDHAPPHPRAPGRAGARGRRPGRAGGHGLAVLPAPQRRGDLEVPGLAGRRRGARGALPARGPGPGAAHGGRGGGPGVGGRRRVLDEPAAGVLLGAPRHRDGRARRPDGVAGAGRAQRGGAGRRRDAGPGLGAHPGHRPPAARGARRPLPRLGGARLSGALAGDGPGPVARHRRVPAGRPPGLGVHGDAGPGLLAPLPAPPRPARPRRTAASRRGDLRPVRPRLAHHDRGGVAGAHGPARAVRPAGHRAAGAVRSAGAVAARVRLRRT